MPAWWPAGGREMLLPSAHFPCRWECRCVPRRGRREERLGVSGLAAGEGSAPFLFQSKPEQTELMKS